MLPSTNKKYDPSPHALHQSRQVPFAPGYLRVGNDGKLQAAVARHGCSSAFVGGPVIVQLIHAWKGANRLQRPPVSQA